MAAVTHRKSLASSTDATSYQSAAFTPAANELLVVFVVANATVAAASVTDSQSLGFTKITSFTKSGGSDTLYLFVANTLCAASSMTVTFDCTGDQATGCIMEVAGVSGMTKVGAAAVRQTSGESNVASGTPAPSFASSALTGNPTLGFMAHATNNNNVVTPPTNWTELFEDSNTTPPCGAEYCSRDSGFTSTTITWGNAAPSAYGDIIVELDTSTNTVLNLVSAPLFVFSPIQIEFGPRAMSGAGAQTSTVITIVQSPASGLHYYYSQD